MSLMVLQFVGERPVEFVFILSFMAGLVELLMGVFQLGKFKKIFEKKYKVDISWSFKLIGSLSRGDHALVSKLRCSTFLANEKTYVSNTFGVSNILS